MSSLYKIAGIGIEAFNKQYRFSYTNKSDAVALKEAVYRPSQSELDNFVTSYDDFNEELLNLETNKDKPAVILDINNQPKEIVELLNKISGGKYRNFMNRHVDGIVFGRNFEEDDGSGKYI